MPAAVVAGVMKVAIVRMVPRRLRCISCCIRVICDDLGERPSEAMKVSVRVCTEGINGDWDQGWGERSRTNE